MKKLSLPILISVAVVASAQEKETQLQDVEIKGKFLRTPYEKVVENIEIITPKEIKNFPATSIDELLQQVAGLDVRRRGALGVQSDIGIRGSSFEQVMILINGVRMNDSQTGHNSMNIPVDLDSVERIEIIKGPAAMRYGNNAYAGIINIITRPENEEKVKISAEGGDFSTYNLGMKSTFGNEKSANLFQINRGGSEGYRHNTDYTISNIFYQNKLSLKNGSVNIQGGFSEKKFGANGFYASPKATEQYEETQASVVSIGHEQRFGNFNLNSTISWRRGQDMYLFNRQKPEIYRNMHVGNNFGGEINGSYTSSLGTTGLGVELRKEFLSSNNLGKRERFISQVFMMHQFSLMDNRLQVIPGISWANFSKEGNFFYPGLDVGFDIDKNHKIYGNIAKVHRIPTFTDLYYLSKTEAGYADLKPENALSTELGYRFLNQNTQIKLSGFLRHTDNAIDWIKLPENTLWNARNVGEIKTKGFEIQAEQKFTDFMKISAGYTFLESSYVNATNSASKYITDHLKHQLIGKLQLNFLKYFTNELSYRYQERLNAESYNLLDNKLGFNKDNFGAYILVNNLTNTRYSEAFGVPMPGRWISVGVSYNIH